MSDPMIDDDDDDVIPEYSLVVWVRELTHLEERQSLYSDIHKDEQWNSDAWLETAIDDCVVALQQAVDRELERESQQSIEQERVEQLLAQAALPIEPLRVRLFDLAANANS